MVEACTSSYRRYQKPQSLNASGLGGGGGECETLKQAGRSEMHVQVKPASATGPLVATSWPTAPVPCVHSVCGGYLNLQSEVALTLDGIRCTPAVKHWKNDVRPTGKQ